MRRGIAKVRPPIQHHPLYSLEKVGDFGLATSSLAAVDPTDKSPHIGLLEDLTLDVGTKLYMAPEATTHPSRRGPQDQNKADMYSLGVSDFISGSWISLWLTFCSGRLFRDELFLLNWC